MIEDEVHFSEWLPPYFLAIRNFSRQRSDSTGIVFQTRQIRRRRSAGYLKNEPEGMAELEVKKGNNRSHYIFHLDYF